MVRVLSISRGRYLAIPVDANARQWGAAEDDVELTQAAVALRPKCAAVADANLCAVGMVRGHNIKTWLAKMVMHMALLSATTKSQG